MTPQKDFFADDEEVKNSIHTPDNEKKVGSEVFTQDMKKLELQVTREMGQNLIQKAIAEHHKKNQEQVQAEVRIILQRVEDIESIRKRSEKRLDLLRNQLQAINDGQFSVREIVRYGQTKLKFNEESLNIDWSQTEAW